MQPTPYSVYTTVEENQISLQTDRQNGLGSLKEQQNSTNLVTSDIMVMPIFFFFFFFFFKKN
jgi:hypothetical protein